MQDLIKLISEAKSLAEYQTASKLCLDYFAVATEGECQEIRKVLRQKAEEIISQASQTRQKAAELITEFENKNIAIEIDGQK